ncbi:LacI family DNA-binding transcriptional regulator [Silvibacterium acidisoli]|uniref:LacI family DNA-binding transcriptional regulator n=1 Tax=Acidobacteriaceae bacterium ZG23-2 TaxID=2883246 RepID=UPI00406D06B9
MTDPHTMTKRATMIEVARLANVGTMTVSRVLNNSTHVSPETASRVHAAIERLGYRPNEIARALRGAKSKSIGLIVPSLADPFFAICAHNINTVARSQGYAMILASSNDSPDTEFAQAEWMLQKHVEGLLICPVSAAHPSRLGDPIFQRTPIVSFDRPLALPNVASVVVENHAGAKKGTQHLIEHGHKHIHFLGDAPDLFTIKTRHEGYRRALLAAKLTPGECMTCNSEEAVFDYLKRVLAEPHAPSAIFAGNNRISRYTFRALNRLELRIPDDIAVIGFDDFDMADMMQPPLTVINQPVDLMGRTAADVLFEKLRLPMEEWPEQESRTSLKVQLVLRASCGCAFGASTVEE